MRRRVIISLPLALAMVLGIGVFALVAEEMRPIPAVSTAEPAGEFPPDPAQAEERPSSAELALTLKCPPSPDDPGGSRNVGVADGPAETAYVSPREALAMYLQEVHLALPAAGFLEQVVDLPTFVQFVYGVAGNPIALVDVENQGHGWAATGSAACATLTQPGA